VMPVAAASQPRLWCFCTLTALYAVLLWWRAPLSTKLQA
jgi:hypothetical protein